MQSKQFARCALVLLMAAGAAVAQPADPLKMAVEQAVNTNPDVSAQRLPRSRRRGGRSAWGAYLPRIDLNAIAGQDRDRIAGTSRTLNRQQGG